MRDSGRDLRACLDSAGDKYWDVVESRLENRYFQKHVPGRAAMIIYSDLFLFEYGRPTGHIFYRESLTRPQLHSDSHDPDGRSQLPLGNV